MIDYDRLKTDLAALGLFAFLLFAALSLISFNPLDAPAEAMYPLAETVSNLCGPIGAKVAHLLMNSLGYACYILIVAAVVFDLRLFSTHPVRDMFLRSLGVGLIIFSVASALSMFAPGLGNPGLYGSGGRIGATGAMLLEKKFSMVGSTLMLLTLLLAGLMLSVELFALALLKNCFVTPVLTLHSKLRPAEPDHEEIEKQTLLDMPLCEVPVNTAARVETKKVTKPKKAKPVVVEEVVDEIVEDELEEDEDDLPAPAPFRVNPPAGSEARRVDPVEEEADDAVPFELPPLDLLEDAEDFPYELLAKKAQIAAATLERTFQEFNLNVKVSEIDTGPVVTQFELDLEPGLRVSRVTALADDLAIALRVPAVRIVSPIPGKNTVGVEVPNDKRVMVRLRELIESSMEDNEGMRLPLFLGKDVSGRPMTVDLAKMPHLLIAGRTGTGKSVCLNTLILSLLMARNPDQVKMLMIDPKMVELSPYMKIPHLMHPVITDMKKAEAVLAWAVDKMEERYDILARCGVRHLDGFNKMSREAVLRKMGIEADSPEADNIPEQMPYIVIIADEMADMMMTSGKDVEGHIIRLAQKSRAVGIHLVLATQKPTVDVITGLIKSNLPARISFQVASRTDSRVVLDEMGAEKLLGNGDMLYLAPGTSTVNRAQGTYVSDEEVNGVIEYLGRHEPEYSQELSQVTSGSSDTTHRGMDAIKERDELYEQAIEVVIREGRGSVSLLQRALGVGYGRGARLIDYMAEDGIVGEYNGSQAREVLYTMEQWRAMQGGGDVDDYDDDLD
ncbi:FtsK/SpoIIIE family DNA translocase [Rubinisphaera margarita]|uniref:FtsK/SpoIIIE family DNA translocase n=1 Tax=Rubinisphaera margarita TaxID=2909586 RepID=UPI001EE8AD8C|nr:DNA translocase FtsK [Rubinisphaera margarita]MCG6154398.1 DNA translocase FtsK [Rubinisphaera margarita]